ncbi:MAG TPA: DUF885 family protein [Polyangia bacterium]|nr:DUF885 family protein [Polyangia bacterium]
MLLLLGAIGGCRSSRPPPAPPVDAGRAGTPPSGPDAQLDQLAREHIDATFAESPTTATWMGAHLYDDRLDDVSPEAIERRRVRLQSLSARLTALPDDRLDPLHRLDRALLGREVRRALFEMDVERPWERNPVRHVSLIASGIHELLTHDHPSLADRMRLVTQRLRQVRVVLEGSRRTLHNPPELLVRRAIELGQNTRGFIAETLPQVTGVLADEALTNDFRAAQGEALHALDDWLSWLQRDLLPHARGELALGRDQLAALLDAEEMLDVPPEQALAVAERELANVKVAFLEAARAVAPGKTPVEALHLLEEDHPKAEDVLATAAATLEAASAFVRERALIPPPTARLKVMEMPPFLWGGATVVLWGPFEAQTRDTWLYAEPVERQWDPKRREEHLRALPRSQMALTTLHQALPGHFVAQEAIRQAPSALERLARSEAFFEGWAGYSEQMMLAEGFGNGDVRLRLALLREQLVQLCRLIAVLRFHAHVGEAKLDDLGDLFADEAYLDDYAARREAERAAIDPMSLAAALGRLQILKLREDFRQERGRAFTLREFHARLLAHGALPLPLVRRTLLIEDHGASLPAVLNAAPTPPASPPPAP